MRDAYVAAAGGSIVIALPECSGEARLCSRGYKIKNVDATKVNSRRNTIWTQNITKVIILFLINTSSHFAELTLASKNRSSIGSRLSLPKTKMRFWSSLTSHFHTHSHHTRVNSQSSELSETAKGKQPEHVEPEVETQKTVHFKKGGRAKGKRLTRKHDRSSGERLRKSVEE
jgi:hypothetical protein